jgi:hypothetical protein
MTDTPTHEETVARFWSRVDQYGGPDACWPYLGALHKNTGYGQFWAHGKNVTAHKFAFTCTKGPIPERKMVLHECDNKPCCNPGHLFSGTHQDNMDDMVAKGRVVTHRGEQHVKSKLTAEIVREVREIYVPRDPEFGGRALARKYNVSQSTMQLALKGLKWAHVGKAA